MIQKYLKETTKYLLRCYPIIRLYVKRINAMYKMSEEELHHRNEERFLQIFRRAYDKSPFYHHLYSEAGLRKEDITCLEDITKLPVVTKDMVKKHAEEMLTVPKWQVIAGHTSGTTGTPLTLYESWPSIWWNQAYTYSARLRNGFRYGQPLVSLRGNLDRNIMSMKVHISNTLYLSSYCINKDTIRKYYAMILDHEPVAIEGYPSSLYTMALCLKEAGLSLHIPVAFTSSETLLDYQRALIEKQLGTEIFDNYGMTEQTIYLQEAYDHKGYYELPGYSINEYLEDGEICTSLTNEAFPLIRYRSNDVIEMAEANSENSLVVVKKILGRVDDFLICKDGSRVTRVDFVEDGKHIKACQWVQSEVGKLSVLIVPDEGFTDEDKEFVLNETIKRVGKDNMDIEVKLAQIDELRLSKRGKFRLIVNEIPKENSNHA